MIPAQGSQLSFLAKLLNSAVDIKMASKVKGLTAVISGGAAGIGFEIADQFLKNGTKVIILDINKTAAQSAMNILSRKYGESVDFINCDITKDLETVYKKIIEQYKSVDILVNSAGIVDEFNALKTMSVNAIALMEMSFKFLEHMRIDKGGKGGTIINISSIYGYRVDPYLPVYKASKYAVFGFTKTLGHVENYNRTGVRVIAICPGATTTNLLKNLKLRDASAQSAFEKYTEEVLSKQTADVVAEAVIEVFNVAESGTAWLIEGARPVEQLP